MHTSIHGYVYTYAYIYTYIFVYMTTRKTASPSFALVTFKNRYNYRSLLQKSPTKETIFCKDCFTVIRTGKIYFLTCIYMYM